jgi:outer membrane protein assembly factor BamC
MNVTFTTAAHRARPAAIAAAACIVLLGGCSSLDSGSSDSIDYRNNTVRAKPLDVPPDLTQLSRDSRYQPQGGAVSAAAVAAGTSTGPAAAGANSVALNTLDGMRIERQGSQRWLVITATPEQVWPQVRAFWEQRGFTLQVDDAKVGVIETSWAENRAKLPQDIVRATIGRIFASAFDSGERDQYRTRLERVGNATEITISHRGMEEVFINERKESTVWRPRATDPQLEAEMLTRLMVSLGAKAEPARVQVAQAADTGATSARARLVVNGTAIEVDDNFDRSWRRVGLALDRGGFTVEDRDRSMGVYYVRWVDPKFAGKDDPNWWDKLTGKGDAAQAVRYRIAVKANGDKTVVAVLTSSGAVDVGDNGKKIAAQLATELR